MVPEASELSLDAAREALELHVRTTTWLRRDLSRTLPIESFARSGSFHVVFKSFTEKRDTGPAHVAFWGGAIDGPENGRAPAAWDIHVDVPGTFINQDHREPIPHTDVVKTCHGCQGSGRVTCDNCGGDGRVRCPRCGGDGRVSRTRTLTRTNAQGQSETYTESYTEQCGNCGGDGQVTCATCDGSGRVTCPTCGGATRLKHYRELHVAWKTHTADHIIEKTDLPDELIQGAVGLVIHSEQDARLEPMTGGAGGPYRGGGRVNAEVNEVANRLISSHSFPGGVKLHCQALVVRAVPVYEARYRWGKGQRRFWVYGTDQQVHAPEYPLSLVRLGAAIGIPVAAVGGVLAFLAAQAPPAPPPPRPTPVVVAAPARTPPPIPEPPPPPPPPPPMEAATGKMPAVPPGKFVVEIRTDPPGAGVTLAGKKVGKTPLFLTLPAAAPGVCTSGKCNVGRCVDGRRCEAVTRVRLLTGDERMFEVELGPSDGPLLEHRF